MTDLLGRLSTRGQGMLAFSVSIVIILAIGCQAQVPTTTRPSTTQQPRDIAALYQASILLQTMMKIWKPMADELQRYANKVGNQDMAANARQILLDTSNFRSDALTSWRKSVDGKIDTEAWLEKARILFKRAVRELEYSSAKTSLVKTTNIGQVVAIVEARRALFTAVFGALDELRRGDLGSGMDFKTKQKLDSAIANGNTYGIESYVRSVTDVLSASSELRHRRIGSVLAKLLPVISYSSQ